MAIEKMSFAHISGPADLLDSVLLRAFHTGLFQPENAGKLSEYSIGVSPSYMNNPYSGLLSGITELAGQLRIDLASQEISADGPFPEWAVCSEAAAERFETLRLRLLELCERKREGLERAATCEEGQDIGDFQELYAAVLMARDAFERRRYAVLFRGLFHVVGYLPARNEAEFKACLDDIADRLDIRLAPAVGAVPDLKIPVQLKNNRFVRPFEMFVEMYGSPSYNDIDPTPFLAFTYCLFFGIMFGDVGQGICISLLGVLLHKWKGMSLGPVMTRIGISSTLFGLLYGSVFGLEHWMDWFYIGVLGLHEKPVEVLRPSTTNRILLAAVGLGAAVILSVMLFNVCVGLKRRDAARVCLSSNGLPGIIFFVSALAAVLSQMTLGRSLLDAPYSVFLIALPLVVIFMKEPIERLIQLSSRETLLHKSRHLSETVKLEKIDADIPALFVGRYIYARFGRLPTDSYRKMRFYGEDPFLLHPIKSDRNHIWCVYTMAASDKEQVDAIFHDFRFERVFIPDEALESSQTAESFIRSCISAGQSPQRGGDSRKRATRFRTILDSLFPDGIANFVVESFFEMFEVLLSFVTNTMSFLRVGGFVLSHAGMMSVVIALSEMAGAGAGPIVLVVGNLFVMGLEGLIVGIQALRLEFYEMFSRFFDAGGEPFSPVSAGRKRGSMTDARNASQY